MISKKQMALRGMLMAATCLTATPAAAEDKTVEERLDRLEALVMTLVEKIDQQERQSSEDRAAVQQAQQAVAETRALATRTEAVEKKVAENKGGGDGFNVGNTNIKIGGYVKLDAITQKTSGGQLPGNSILRDFFIPSTIPVGGASSGFDTDFNARQTRIFVRGTTDVGEHKLGGYLELDFMVTSGGDERISNSFVPRMRQAYITFDDWLFGQTWSTFQNVGALPDSLDFIGVTPGTVFDRQPMIRYSKNGFSVALEQPETEVTTATGGRVIPGDDKLPDFVLRYQKNGLAIAGILRQLNAGDGDFAPEGDSAFGYGVSVSGKVPIGKNNDFRFMATAGDGLGRYIGLNIVNDAAVTATGRLDPIFTYSGFAAFRHKWSDNLRSTIAGSYFKADNPVALTGFGPTDQVWNGLVNLIYSPAPKFDVGIEYMYAERETEGGLDGNLQKVQVSAKYSF